MFKTGGRKIRYDIHKIIMFIWNKDELPEKWKESIIAPIYKNDDKTDCNKYRGYQFCQQRTKLYPTSCCQD
jgi:hypothetical protein